MRNPDGICTVRSTCDIDRRSKSMSARGTWHNQGVTSVRLIQVIEAHVGNESE
jgi:hypothetical protein